MDDDARTVRRARGALPRDSGAPPPLGGLSDFFPRELRCANCGARFVTRVRDGAPTTVRDGGNLCPVCFSALAEAARSRSLLVRRRCA